MYSCSKCTAFLLSTGLERSALQKKNGNEKTPTDELQTNWTSSQKIFKVYVSHGLKAMRSKVLDLRPNIFQMTWGFFSFFIIHYYLLLPIFDDILAIYWYRVMTIKYVNLWVGMHRSHRQVLIRRRLMPNRFRIGGCRKTPLWLWLWLWR